MSARSSMGMIEPPLICRFIWSNGESTWTLTLPLCGCECSVFHGNDRTTSYMQVYMVLWSIFLNIDLTFVLLWVLGLPLEWWNHLLHVGLYGLLGNLLEDWPYLCVVVSAGSSMGMIEPPLTCRFIWSIGESTLTLTLPLCGCECSVFNGNDRTTSYMQVYMVYWSIYLNTDLTFVWLWVLSLPWEW